MRTFVYATPLDLQGARASGLAPSPFERGLYAGTGALESAETPAPPFDELVGSWNAALPRGAWIELRAQARVGGRWTAWYGLGRWDADGGGRSLGAQADADGEVAIDTLKLKAPADAFRFRVALGGAAGATLERAAIAVSRSSASPAPHPFRPGPWVRELKVPPRSQMEEQEKYRHDICSPTSLSMVLDYWGKRLATVTVAEGVRDRASMLFGNWPLNVAFAGLRGAPGHVARLDGLAGVEREIAAGRPVVVSITFSEGELSGSPMRRTNGHLLVVAGFTKDGDVIVRDPAGKTRGAVRRVYRRAELEKVWAARKRGVAYVLGPRFPSELVVGVTAADLRRRPAADAVLGTQLLYGERVRALRAKGDWVEVEALEQPGYGRERRWHPYRGWTPAAGLRSIVDFAEPDAVVAAKRAALIPDSGPQLSVDLGTRLRVESVSGDRARVRLPDGRTAETAAAFLRRLGAPPDRAKILEEARRFLGDPYVWGGRSTSGVDCSGLTSLSYRAEGVDLPRDAQDQFAKARRIARAELEPGDLVFLSKPGSPKTITHVMLYAGGERLIESRQAAGKALETTFQERFGQPLSAIDSGATVVDRTGSRPQKRTIYFGSVL